MVSGNATQHGDQGTRDLVVTRVIDAPVEQVWRAWTEAEYVKQWWGPDGFTCPVAEMDVREGGTSLVAMSSPDFGENYSLWAYETIEPYSRIVYIHNLSDAEGNRLPPADLGMPPDFPQDVRNVVTFRALDAGNTELTVTEQGDFTEQWYELSKTGLEQCLDKMTRIFSERS